MPPVESPELRAVDVALTPERKFAQFLASRGKKFTPECRIIVEEVFADHEHFDVDSLVAKLERRRDSRRVSRATIYRRIAQLVEAGLLREIAVGNRKVYEHDYGYPEHDHLYCTECEKLIEFHEAAIDEIRERVARRHDFRATGQRFVIYGICSDCNLARSSKRRLDLV